MDIQSPKGIYRQQKSNEHIAMKYVVCIHAATLCGPSLVHWYISVEFSMALHSKWANKILCMNVVSHVGNHVLHFAKTLDYKLSAK